MRGSVGGLIAMLMFLSLARAEDLSALLSRGWTVQNRGTLTRLQWQGPGRTDVIQALLGSPERTTASPKAWLQIQRARVETKTGRLQSCRETDAPTGNVTGTICQINSPSGILFVGMIAARAQPGTLRLVTLISSPTPASRERLVADLPQFVQLAQSASIPAPTESGATPASPSVPNPVATASASGTYLAPGKGIPPEQIEGVYHHWNWMMMLNMGMIDTGSDYILFKNGDVWRNPQLPPQDIDIVKAKHATQTDWGSWRRAGGQFVIRLNGGAEERYDSSQLIRYEAAAREQRVEGSWHTTLSSVSNIGGHSTTGVVTNTITLHRDGRFERDGFSGASFQNQTGATRAGGTFTNARPARTGHYRIDGYTLELDYDDGRVERDLFYWAGGHDKPYDMLLLNGSKYLGALKR